MIDWRNKPRVMIIDDDTDFSADLSVMLSHEFNIRAVASTSEADREIMDFRPDCLLLDIGMPEYYGDDPESEGLNFLNHLYQNNASARRASVPVILVTALADRIQQKSIISGRVAACYSKPPDIRVLSAAIWNSLDRAAST